MATITRSEEMFTGNTGAAARVWFQDLLYRAINHLFLPDWVIQYAEERSKEIKRQQFSDT